MKVNIKDVKVGQVVQFDRHAHWVLDDELICDFMFGTVMQDLSHNGKDWNGQVIVNLHNSEYQDYLDEFDTGFGKNNLIFLSPDDDDMYKDVNVTIINEKPDQTYHVLIPVRGSIRASVMAKSCEEALERIKDGFYETDDAIKGNDSFSLDECTTLEDELELEDIIDLNE
tara:strand:+ start:1535 stop:2044 length:510 start_codon:yes stop_codon:yes gene_type:complete